MKLTNSLSAFVAVAAAALTSSVAQAQIPNTFVNGQVANAISVNANFDYLEAERAANLARIATLEAANAALETRLSALETVLTPANLAKLTDLLPTLSMEQTDDMNGSMIDTVRFTGVNVQIVNGTGATATRNSAGNLLLGYAEMTAPSGDAIGPRTGSHNIVSGRANSYDSTAGIVAGESNTVVANNACVLSGTNNFAVFEFGVVISGEDNVANNIGAVCVTGIENIAGGLQSAIVGGSENRSNGALAVTVGGAQNNANINGGTCVGGISNETTGAFGVVVGGQNNTAVGVASVLSGGDNRMTAGPLDWVAGSLFEND